MRLKLITLILGGAGALAACGPAPTPQQQAARQHEIACLSGTIGGALIGGVIGNQFGGGSGKTILTAAGAAAGGLSGERYAC
ncbi:glycine zipper 2TM domain-containing protein [Ruegeria conchae]|uniref:17 kDa surface antigen n=1 Tax=Ruegeria conchae TaxID=981384 RepID=A0A497Z9I1_9RHOB|nr:glycine zipper 2TM domain-containing protein [Ruegeria conchae]RLJ99886.1 glycine zipper 2TM protein [Ruegeria conchae]UWR02671.1 glycine zipper 2TM domain-containing protein [Ruegeria conchae]